MRKSVLGIAAYYHDSAACLIVDGQVVAAAHEERFTRKKHDADFPAQAVQYCLREAGLTLEHIDAVVFYDKPFLKFERLLETFHLLAPRGLKNFLKSMPVWVKEKLFLRRTIWRELDHLAESDGLGQSWKKPALLFSEHHLSHAASAYYPSQFADAAVLTIDGVGEWATTTILHGQGEKLKMIGEVHFPHSVGLLYSAFTYYCGFKVNSGEYKLMGLAPYGLRGEDYRRYKNLILEHLVDVRPDGSIVLNLEYFDFLTGDRMCRDDRWRTLFGLPRRQAETELTQEYMDMALAIQDVTEDIVLRLAQTAKNLTGSKNLVMAGGVALNCVANGKVQRSGIFENVWFQPAAGDAGGAMGAAYTGYHIFLGEKRVVAEQLDALRGSYLGPRYDNREVERMLRRTGAVAKQFSNFSDLAATCAKLLAEGKVVGWHQGRMEWGPRALGNRSILGDPRNPEMQKTLNLKIKYREGFRPFAPAVLSEEAERVFEQQSPSPYMQLVAQVRPERCRPLPAAVVAAPLLSRLYHQRSDLPAITHIDYSARLQTVHAETNPRFHALLHEFKKLTGIGVLVNTSFNVRGEPIVCTPDDSYRCFMRTEMDYLVVEDFLFEKTAQPTEGQARDSKWRQEFTLD